MSKSKRTQQRYAKQWKGQTGLAQFGFKVMPSSSTIPKTRRVSEIEELSDSEGVGSDRDSDTMIFDAPICPPPNNEAPINNMPLPGMNTTPSSPTTPEQSTGGQEGHEEEELEDESNPVVESEEQLETWEEELDAGIAGLPNQVKGWDILRDQIKTELKKKSKMLTLPQINQMMILSNFATLSLKGISRIQASEEIAHQWHEGEGKWFARRVRALARHYEVFEQLPIEHRGGLKNVRSLLKDETVKKRTREYLTNLPTGKVTPKGLQNALNSEIFPELGITPKN